VPPQNRTRRLLTGWHSMCPATPGRIAMRVCRGSPRRSSRHEFFPPFLSPPRKLCCPLPKNKKVLHGCQTQGAWVLHDCQTQGVWDCHVCHIQVTWVWHFIKPKIPGLDANCVQSYWTWRAVKFKVMWVRHVCRSKCLAYQAYKRLSWLFFYIYFLIFQLFKK
jgi:hypothetical protein